jgi:hypothetical protein
MAYLSTHYNSINQPHFSAHRPTLQTSYDISYFFSPYHSSIFKVITHHLHLCNTHHLSDFNTHHLSFKISIDIAYSLTYPAPISNGLANNISFHQTHSTAHRPPLQVPNNISISTVHQSSNFCLTYSISLCFPLQNAIIIAYSVTNRSPVGVTYYHNLSITQHPSFQTSNNRSISTSH